MYGFVALHFIQIRVTPSLSGFHSCGPPLRSAGHLSGPPPLLERLVLFFLSLLERVLPGIYTICSDFSLVLIGLKKFFMFDCVFLRFDYFMWLSPSSGPRMPR